MQEAIAILADIPSKNGWRVELIPSDDTATIHARVGTPPPGVICRGGRTYMFKSIRIRGISAVLTYEETTMATLMVKR